MFQFVPAPHVVLAMADPGPVVLVPAAHAAAARQDWRWPTYGVAEGDGPALALGGGDAVLSLGLASRLGRGAWDTLGTRADNLRLGPLLTLIGLDEAVTMLAALGAGALDDATPRGEWPEAAMRWRQRPTLPSVESARADSSSPVVQG